MPVIPGFFNRYDEIVNCSSDFARLIMNDEYKTFIIESRLAGFPDFPAPDAIEYFNDTTITMADRVHHYLMNLGRYANNNFNKLDDVGIMYYLLAKNQYFFYRIFANLPPLDSYYGLDDLLAKELSQSPWGIAIAVTANKTIADLPSFTSDNYDVKWWSRGYEGQMAFIGANTSINTQGGKFQGFYAFPNAVGYNMIKRGDIISNRAPILAYASPYRPMEFCLRQAMNYLDPHLPGFDAYEELFARRVVFEIDFISAKNIAPWAGPEAEELIFAANRRFKVVEIEESVAQGQTIGLIVRLQEIPESSVPSGTRYRDLISGEFYDKLADTKVDLNTLSIDSRSQSEITAIQQAVINLAKSRA